MSGSPSGKEARALERRTHSYCIMWKNCCCKKPLEIRELNKIKETIVKWSNIKKDKREQLNQTKGCTKWFYNFFPCCFFFVNLGWNSSTPTMCVSQLNNFKKPFICLDIFFRVLKWSAYNNLESGFDDSCLKPLIHPISGMNYFLIAVSNP